MHPATQTMAQAEGLWAHALSAGLRRKMVEEGLEGFDGVDFGRHQPHCMAG